MVMHASKDRGQFVLTTFDEFREGQHARHVQVPGNPEVQQAILQRAESLLDRRFDLFAANCEDYVNWIVTGVARSPQREAIGITAFVIVAIFVFGRALAR
jgi:hypothetical protein